MQTRRALVTGGAGFIGSNLCRQLIAQGHEVLCADNFFTGRRANIADLLDYRSFDLLHHDVTEPLFVEADEIYHLACPGSPVHYGFDPIHTTKTNVLGAINVLGLAKRLKVRVLFSSTSEVYGDPLVHPQTEEYWGNVNSFGPRACYDEGKRCAESLFYDYHHRHGVEIKIARIFNTYGPGMDPADGRVVSNFIAQALQGEPITIYGDGRQTRSFCYVDDLVDGLLRLMRSSKEVTGPINLGNPGEFTVRQLVDKVIDIVDTRSIVVHKPLPQDDPTRRRPDISRAHRELGWTPKTALDDGLLKTARYFRDTLQTGTLHAAVPVAAKLPG